MTPFRRSLFILLLPIGIGCIFDDNEQTASSPSFSITSPEENASITAANAHIFPVQGTCRNNGQTLLFQVGSQNIGTSQCQSNNTFAVDLDFLQVPDGSLTLEIFEDSTEGEAIDISLEKIIRPYISRWTTIVNDEEVELYLNNTGTYNFWLDYGDGSPQVLVTSDTDPDARHFYATPGTYTITITGLCTGMDGSNFYGISAVLGRRTYQNQLIEVVDLGNVGWQTFEGMFFRAANLTDVSGGDTSEVTNMNNMFAWATNSTPDTSGWVVDNVTEMGTTFLEANLADPDVSNWNVGQVTNMAGMFWTATAADPDVSSWDVSRVTTMSRMFSETTADPDVSNWDVGLVTDMSSMFHDATAADPDVSSWNVSRVIDMRWMFFQASAADPDMGNWNWHDSVSIRSDDFLFNTNIGQAHYTALLIRLASENPNFTSKIIETSAMYNPSAASSRTMLTGSLGWSITDGGQVP